jgi:hypothetical protein
MENMKIKKIFFFIILLVITGLYLSCWLNCYLDSKFFFSPLDLKLRIIFDVRTDQNVPLIVARLFHNKLTQGSTDIFNAYFHFWDIRFLLMLLSPFTLFFILYKIFNLIKNGISLLFYEKFILLLCLLSPMPIIFNFAGNKIVSIIIFAFPLILLSLSGLFLFIKRHSSAWAYCIFFIAISLWYTLILDLKIVEFCHP